MFIKAFKHIWVPRLVRGEVGREELGLPTHSSRFRTWWRLWKDIHYEWAQRVLPCQAWQGADWAEQSSGALFMWQLPAAEDWASCSLGGSKPLSRSFPGHWAVLICNQRPKDETQNAYSECPSQEWLPHCSQVQPQFPSPKISPSEREALLSLRCSSSERVSLPDQQIYVHFPRQHHPLPDFQVSQVTGTHLSHITGQRGSHRRTEVHAWGLALFKGTQ